MVDAGGPVSVRKCHEATALADLGDTYGFGRNGVEGRLYAFQLSEGVYKRKEITLEGVGEQAFSDLTDIDTSHAVPKRLHQLAFTGNKWVAFADPVQQTGWLIDVKIAPPYVATGKDHKLKKVVNSGTKLCSYIPETRNVIISADNTLTTSNNRRGVLNMVSEFSPAGIIGLGLPISTILIEILLGERPDDFVDIIPGFKLKWPAKHANKSLGIRIVLKETPQVDLTLREIQQQADLRFLDLAKIFLGPVALKRLRFTPGELAPDQAVVLVNS